MSLESEIYKLSFELSKSLSENEINKLLGVLASDGVYAMWVYAMDRFEDNKNIIIELIKKLDNFVMGKKQNYINNQYFQELAKDLNKLLFMKELLEKVLIYARYHKRAGEDK